MLPRRILTVLHRRLEAYPAVILIGPRQCGKTTLAKSLPTQYYDLEQDTDRLRLDLEWTRVLAGRKLIVLDEAQAWPEIFPMLRGAIDAQRDRNGRFLLLGSISPALMRAVSESLAGRLSLVEMSPFSLRELPDKRQRQRRWLLGGYANGGVIDGQGYPTWQQDYLKLLVQRDLPNWGLTATPQVAERLLRMLSAMNGQEWNASQLGKSLGLSYHTVNRYLDYLEGAFLVRRLPAWHANIRKRLVKRPKMYWRDSGLLHALLGVQNPESLLAHPCVGFSWEGFAIEQILTALSQTHLHWSAYYLRTQDQHEINLVVEVDGEIWAMEMKLTSRPSPEDLRRLTANADLIDAKHRFLVCQECEEVSDGVQTLCNLEGIVAYIEARGTS